eukprot:TRINITY_DN7708_c0_g1_i1.p1 TRINITY_DN7708_c0_g1~~TRINITY_DN7708_c0_g1_i1.p1  ORF type:complete len:1144 (+),score=263.57 TRINITY_DN7708_c0_g1_i1:38-3469(+)
MSRAERKGQAFSSDAKLFVVSNGEYKSVYSPQSPLIILRGSGVGDAVKKWIPLSKRVLEKGSRAVYILDIVSLMKEQPRENSIMGLGPVLKPISRTLQKLNPKSATLVGLGSAGSIVAKLLRQEALSDIIGEGIIIQPDTAPTLRDPPLKNPVSLHLIQMSKNDDELLDWTSLAPNLTTSLTVGATVGHVVDAIFDRYIATTPELPPCEGEPDIRTSEIMFTISPYTKQTEQVIQPMKGSGGSKSKKPSASTTATVTAPPATEEPKSNEESKPVTVNDTPVTTTPPAATVTAAKPSDGSDRPEVPKWWSEDRDDFYSSESHIWTVRAGATIERLRARVIASELPKSKTSCGWAKVADVHGSIRVAYCASHARAFKLGNAVCITGRVLTDSNGVLYISVPNETHAAVSLGPDEELSILVTEQDAMTAAEMMKTGISNGEVKHTYGCALIRGSKIALARVKDSLGRKELAIPCGVAIDEETPEATAMRVLAQALDVDPDEYSIASHLGTITRFPKAGCVETIFIAFANRSPPGGASKDKKDIPVDPLSPYDWFTLDHSLRCTYNNWHSTLWNVARRLSEASSAGIVARKWNCGVFGVDEVNRDGVSHTDPSPQQSTSLSGLSLPEGLEAITSALQEYAVRAQELQQQVEQQNSSAAPQQTQQTQQPQQPDTDTNKNDEKVTEQEPPQPVKEETAVAPVPPPTTNNQKLRTTVLSGWLGAGKTTLLKRIIGTDLGLRIAILVNDMAEVNIDAALVRGDVTVTKAEENLVELSSGCICCTLRQDLLEEVAKLANAGRFDYLIIESSGVSEPLHVAETFTFDINGSKLSDIAEVDTMVTVVDGPIFIKDVKANTNETLASTGMLADDERSVVKLLIEQVEFADIILVNKNDLLDDNDRKTIESLIREFNNHAKIIFTITCNVDMSEIIQTGLYSEEKSKLHEEWLEAEHIHPDMGISSFTYRVRRPFHPKRLHEKLYTSGLPTVIRSKGYTWLASRTDQVGVWSQAARLLTLDGGQHWWKAIPKEEWPAEVEGELERTKLWEEPHGDKQQEIVIIGYKLDEQGVRKALDSCLLTDEEFAQPEHTWTSFEDPFPSWVEDAHTHNHDGEHNYSYQYVQTEQQEMPSYDGITEFAWKLSHTHAHAAPNISV